VQIELAQGWLGTGVSRASVAGASIACVHRIKVDEAEGIAILSFSIGGLAVVDLRDRYRLIWSIPPVRSRARRRVRPADSRGRSSGTSMRTSIMTPASSSSTV
jgi:hypothetical protein